MLDGVDAQFGPVSTGRFDFTILFEHAMLGIVPTGIVILATPVFVKAARAHRQARPGFQLWAKLLVGLALVAVHLASLVLWHSAARTGVSLAASILSFVASVCVVAIVCITHIYAIQSSAFLSLFLTVTMLFDITMARSYYMRGGLGAISSLQVAIASLKLALVLLEELPRRHLLRTERDRETAGNEQVVGFWNRTMLLWVTRILILGSRKTLTIDDLPSIGQNYGSERLFDHFTPYWHKLLDGNASNPLIKALFLAIWWQIVCPMLPRLCFIGFSFGRPFLMQRVMDVVGSGGAPTDVTTGLIGASILVFGGLMLSRSVFERLEYQAKTCVRGILVVAIYSKIQTMSMDDIASSGAVSMMSADVSGVEDILTRMHATWASCIELGLGIFVLYKYVGYACFLIFIPTVIASIATFHVSKRMAKARTAWNEKIEARVSDTSNVLAQLKSIKAMGLSKAFSNYLNQKRVEEVNASMAERNARVSIFAIYAFGNTMAPVVVFAGARFWTRVDNPMTVPEIFATYAVIFIVALPISELLGYLPYYASGWACIVRIQKLLLRKDLPDHRDSNDMPHAEQFEMTEKPGPVFHPRPYAVEMNHVSYTAETGGSVLRDVTLRILNGSINMVHGTVGSGKSAFLKALLGELPIDTGTIDIETKLVAFADQTPWIQNMTIQDNIIGPYPFIESLYDQVLEACDLFPDLEELQDGDQTMAGSNGCNLSGGQKQRIGLARALFSRSSIIILDDIFSALDAETAVKIANRLIGPEGLLREWNTTTIMTTNKLELLDAADVVFEVTENGAIRQDRRVKKVFTGVQQPRAVPAVESETSPSVSDLAEPPCVDTSMTEDLPAAKRKSGDFRLYMYFFRAVSLFWLTLWILGVAIAAVLERMPQIFMRIWLSIDVSDNTYFAGFVALSVGDILAISIIGLQFFKQLLPGTSTEIHRAMLDTVMGSHMAFLSHTDAGSLLNRFSQDVALISQELPVVLFATLSMFFNVLVDVGIISSGAKYAAPIVIFLIVVLYTVQHFYLKTSRQLRLLQLETASPLVTHMTESSTGMAHIRSFGWNDFYQDEFLARLDNSQKPHYYLFCIQQWLRFVLDFTTFVAAVALISIALVYPHSSEDSAIGLALLNLISFSATASLFITLWVRLETSLGGLARIKEFCEETPQEEGPEEKPAVPEEWPATGKIDFNCVTASYRGPTGDLRRALNNTSVSIKHGQKVSIMGRTGSGKTSMMLAILHMIEFSGGISIDNREIKTIPRSVLRSRITTLTQDGVLLRGPVRFNMFPFDAPVPEDDHLIGALESVGLWRYIEKRGGLDADIVQVRLTPGQRQLFFIARAILHQQVMDTKVVLVDEATSSLDAAADADIQELMDEAFADCTVVHIAHRRETFDNVDLSIELSAGEVVTMLRRNSRTGYWVAAQ